ncbi:MAG: hypothetical protein CBC35_06280 [Planctomycetes bacterium TMED75]|nr:MAG: hypothetical protein CBC35_06280 [Planctomycetes bacterium TMED75]
MVGKIIGVAKDTMFHIATVHYKDDRWIDIQLDYLKKNLKTPYRVYAILNGVMGHKSKFYFAQDYQLDEAQKEKKKNARFPASVDHALKLDYLAKVIAEQANDEDIILFLDGDALPVRDNTYEFVAEKIKDHQLIAMQRSEIDGMIQPHPAFCVTKVSAWKELQGSWGLDYQWEHNGEKMSDTGANLLEALEKSKTNWLPLERSNLKNEHELFYGIYGNIVYHHGAGFRGGLRQFISIKDYQKFPQKYLVNMVMVRPYRENPPHRWTVKIFRRLLQLFCYLRVKKEQNIFRDLKTNSKFYERFLK